MKRSSSLTKWEVSARDFGQSAQMQKMSRISFIGSFFSSWQSEKRPFTHLAASFRSLSSLYRCGRPYIRMKQVVYWNRPMLFWYREENSNGWLLEAVKNTGSYIDWSCSILKKKEKKRRKIGSTTKKEKGGRKRRRKGKENLARRPSLDAAWSHFIFSQASYLSGLFDSVEEPKSWNFLLPTWHEYSSREKNKQTKQNEMFGSFVAPRK